MHDVTNLCYVDGFHSDDLSVSGYVDDAYRLPAAWLHWCGDAVHVQFGYLIVGGYRQLLGRCNTDVQTFSSPANDDLL